MVLMAVDAPPRGCATGFGAGPFCFVLRKASPSSYSGDAAAVLLFLFQGVVGDRRSSAVRPADRRVGSRAVAVAAAQQHTASQKSDTADRVMFDLTKLLGGRRKGCKGVNRFACLVLFALADPSSDFQSLVVAICVCCRISAQFDHFYFNHLFPGLP